MKPSAVVVDDAESQATQLARILTKRGIEVLAICESGPEGLAAIRRFRPTIATIDNQMPGLDGISVIRTLTTEKSPTLLVMCSGTAQASVKAAAREAGAVSFIVKPYDNVIAGREIEAVLKAADRE